MYSLSSKPAKVLDFDIETRRIGFHSAGRFAPDGCEPVIIAWGWADGHGLDSTWMAGVWTKRRYKHMLQRWLHAYAEADVVTGHYIRKFDLPILNGACLEMGLGPLPEKLVSDTKTDLINIAGLSQSQENLSAMLELEQHKFHMSDNDWRSVARLTPEGIEEARKRCTKDVAQHQALRERLIEEGFLGRPEVWKP